MLPMCENCKTPFYWSQIAKSLLRVSHNEVTCKSCNMLHMIDFSSRFIFIGLGFIPALAFASWWSPMENAVLESLIAVIILIIGFLVTPFFVRYREVKKVHLKGK